MVVCVPPGGSISSSVRPTVYAAYADNEKKKIHETNRILYNRYLDGAAANLFGFFFAYWTFCSGFEVLDVALSTLLSLN